MNSCFKLERWELVHFYMIFFYVAVSDLFVSALSLHQTVDLNTQC